MDWLGRKAELMQFDDVHRPHGQRWVDVSGATVTCGCSCGAVITHDFDRGESPVWYVTPDGQAFEPQPETNVTQAFVMIGPKTATDACVAAKQLWPQVGQA